MSLQKIQSQETDSQLSFENLPSLLNKDCFLVVPVLQPLGEQIYKTDIRETIFYAQAKWILRTTIDIDETDNIHEKQ